MAVLDALFLDASVLLAAEDTTNRHHQAAGELIRTIPAATSDLALYEVTNVAALLWRDSEAASRLQRRIFSIESTRRLLRADSEVMTRTAQLVSEHRLSSYDASYVAGAERLGLQLVSCDERDLVRPGLAITPADALALIAEQHASEPAADDPPQAG